MGKRDLYSKGSTRLFGCVMRLVGKKIDNSSENATTFNNALSEYVFEESGTSRRSTRVSNFTKPFQQATRKASLKRTNQASIQAFLSPHSSPIKKKLKQSPINPPTKAKAKRPSAGYAPPSKYAHLVNNLTDSLAPDLICVFIGVNPGIRTATTGHAYNHPSNLFWRLLHSSGCTPRRCHAEEDGDMPELYSLGLTNIVSRPTKDASELSKDEMDEGVAVLEEKTRKLRPEAVAIVGKSIWESIWRVRHGKKISKQEFKYGWQHESENMGVVSEGEDQWPGAKVFVATTTSGLAAGMRPYEKEEIWAVLGKWVEQRRREREDASQSMKL